MAESLSLSCTHNGAGQRASLNHFFLVLSAHIFLSLRYRRTPLYWKKKGNMLFICTTIAFLWNYNKHFFLFFPFLILRRDLWHTHTHTFRSPPTTTTNCRRKWLTADFTGSGSVTLEIHRKIWDLHVNFDSICQGIFESYISITNFFLKWKKEEKKTHSKLGQFGNLFRRGKQLN